MCIVQACLPWLGPRFRRRFIDSSHRAAVTLVKHYREGFVTWFTHSSCDSGHIVHSPLLWLGPHIRGEFYFTHGCRDLGHSTEVGLFTYATYLAAVARATVQMRVCLLSSLLVAGCRDSGHSTEEGLFTELPWLRPQYRQRFVYLSPVHRRERVLLRQK